MKEITGIKNEKMDEQWRRGTLVVGANVGILTGVIYAASVEHPRLDPDLINAVWCMGTIAFVVVYILSKAISWVRAASKSPDRNAGPTPQSASPPRVPHHARPV